MEYEYKKVEGMTVGQVVDAMLNGQEFSTKVIDSYCLVTLQDVNLINKDLSEGKLYTRTEKPWWEGCEGMPVMVRDRDRGNQNWHTTIFAQFDKNSSHPFIGIDNRPYKYMRARAAAPPLR